MAVGILIPALGVLLIATLGLMLAHGWEATFGQVINWAVNELGKASVPLPFGLGHINVLSPIIDVLQAIDGVVHNAIGLLEQANDWAWNAFISAMAYSWQELSAAVGDLAEATDQALGYLERHVIPKLVAGLLVPFAGVLQWVVPTVHQLMKDAANLAYHPERVIGKTITKVEHLTTTVTKAVTVTVPTTIIRTRTIAEPRIGALERDFTGLEKWVRANVKKVSIAGAVGLVAGAVFSTLQLGWLRCSNVNRVGKALCGFDRALLDALLAGLAVWLGTLSLEAFAKDVKAVTGTIEGEVRHFWRADVKGAGAGHTFGTSGV